ncbi:Heme-binding protein A [subsurface metagenome]
MGKEHVMEAREFTADDVVFSINRFLDSQSAQWGARRTELGGWVDSITATDRYTVVIETSRFSFDWIRWVGGTGECLVYAPEVVEAGVDDWNNLVGTGPFMFDEYVVGSHYKFKKNPDYWRTTPIAGVEYKTPFVDYVVLPIIKDISTRVSALRTGKLDYYPIVDIKQAESLDQTTPELLKFTYLDTWQRLIALRCDLEPFSNKTVRQAMMIALDRPAINRAAFYEGETYPWLIETRSPDHIPLAEQPPSAQVLYEYNPALAKQMLAEAGYPDGFKVTAVVSSLLTDSIEILEMTEAYWEAIGVELKIEVLEPVTYTARTSFPFPDDYQVLIANCGNEGFFHAVEKNWWGQQPDGWGWNYARYNNLELSPLFDEIMTTPDLDKRQIMWREAAFLVLDDVPYISVGAPNVVNYWWPWVKNYYGETYSGRGGTGYIMAVIWIDQNLKAEMGYK